MAAPHYVAGIDFNPAVRQDAFDVMARLIEHYRNKSTDQAPEQWREPVRRLPGSGAVGTRDAGRLPQGAAAARAVLRAARARAPTRPSTSPAPRS